ncbi:MAG: prepilin peptidase [Elusimicrobiota bacterium]
MKHILAFALGSILGSFANVVAPRLSKGQAPWRPVFSYCPACLKRIRPWDNVPIISFLLLKGRCRDCGVAIPRRYPLIELSMGLLGLVTLWRVDALLTMTGAPATGIGWWVTTTSYTLLCWTLLCISVIDIDEKIIPDGLNLLLLSVMISTSPLNPLLPGMHPVGRLMQSMLGAIVLGGAFLGIAIIGEKLFKQEAMGGGDIKLAAALGAAFGYPSCMSVIMTSCALGLLWSLPNLLIGKLKRKDAIPFGPFMAAAALLYLFFSCPGGGNSGFPIFPFYRCK